MPHPNVVEAFPDALFPVIRASAKLGKRGEVTVCGDRSVMLDDNTSPRWALLWSHGIGGYPSYHGWTFAHIWDRSSPEAAGPGAYTHLANLCMMPEFFGSLSDKDGPLVAHLKYHAWEMYGWSPTGAPWEKPDGYETLDWQYLDKPADPRAELDRLWRSCGDKRARLLRTLTNQT